MKTLLLFTAATLILMPIKQLSAAGNGAPSGSHYNLNIIGVPKNKSASMTGTMGHTIFMPLAGSSKILLTEGPFEVIDRNGTDGSASFSLPNPDPENDGITLYSVYARSLGKPGGSATVTTCAIDRVTLEEVCSLNALVAVRTSGKQSFTNVSKDLLYMYVDTDGDGRLEQVNLFNDKYKDFFWQYDNNGLKVLQLRFYPISSNVN
jgi:hypothetical protein